MVINVPLPYVLLATYFSHQDKSKREKSKLSEKIKLNTTLMDKKTQLLDENATLEQRRKKDKVALDKVSDIETNFIFFAILCLKGYHRYLHIIIIELSCSLQSANSENQKISRNYVSCGSFSGLKNASFMK